MTNANNTEGALNRVGSGTITSNGGLISYINTASGTAYAETLGSIALNSGQLTVLSTNAVTSGTEILTFGGLTQSGTATVAFAAGGGLNTGTNQMKVTGAVATTANRIIGPWADGRHDCRCADGLRRLQRNDEFAWCEYCRDRQRLVGNSHGQLYVESRRLGHGNPRATRTINSLRYTGAAATLALSTFNLETYGLLNGGTGVLTISGGGAIRQQGTAAANLYVTTGSSGITIGARDQRQHRRSLRW